MTYQEYQARVTELQQRKQEIEQMRTSLSKEYISHAPFKSGDKVEVVIKGGTIAFVLYVSRVSPPIHRPRIRGI